MVLGFAVALGAAGFWGVGNVVTRWTLRRVPRAAFDVVLLKYLVAATLLVAVALLLRARHGRPDHALLVLRNIPPRKFVAASLAKGVNTYTWVLAAALIPAGPVATLETLHVVWTGLAVAVLFHVRVPRGWIAGAAAALAGATLITATPAEGFSSSGATGVALGLAAGLAFATFVILWTGLEKRHQPLWERTLAMGALLLVSGIVLYPLHLAVSLFWLGGSRWPLQEVGLLDGAVQCVNGLFGIGAAYFLLNEASALLEGAGKLSGLLLAIGLSFAVPVTLLTEALALGTPVSPVQWAGVALFVLGFVAVRGSLRQAEKAG
jgi:drug/metabolite transporter (DMT)-like permease